MAFDCLQDGLGPGHYKLPFVERLAPRSKAHGPGRIYLAELSSRDVKTLAEDEHAIMRLDDKVTIGGYTRDAIRLRDKESKLSIHAGGESLSRTMALSNFQPLTVIHRGVRMHNADLIRLMDFLQPRLYCGQIIVLTIV